MARTLTSCLLTFLLALSPRISQAAIEGAEGNAKVEEFSYAQWGKRDHRPS